MINLISTKLKSTRRWINGNNFSISFTKEKRNFTKYKTKIWNTKSDIEEVILENESPESMVVRLAYEKAYDVAQKQRQTSYRCRHYSRTR